MSASVSINPALQTNAAGTFNVTSLGVIQGMAYPDPASRFYLAGGILASTESIVMWGGVAISELVAGGTSTPNTALGSLIKRATSVTAPTGGQSTLLPITGFSVFNQNYGALNTPQSPVPLVPSGGQVNFYRLGSRARIAVQMDPVLLDAQGYLVSSLFSWDYQAQMLVPYQAAYAANAVVASSWSAGKITWTTTSNHGVAVGSTFEMSGGAPSGYNGKFTAVTGTATTSLVATAANPGSSTTQGTLVAGGGALNVGVLDVMSTNCMTVSYDSTTGFATWNRNGACAIILL